MVRSRRLFSLALLFGLVGCLFVAPVFATFQIYLNNPYANIDGARYWVFTSVHPSSGAALRSAAAQCFVGNGQYLASATFYIKGVNDTVAATFDFSIGCQLLGTTGSYGTTMVPNATVFETSSTTFSYASITHSSDWSAVNDYSVCTFYFTSHTFLRVGQYYAISVYCLTGSGLVQGDAAPVVGGTVVGGFGDTAQYINSAWSHATAGYPLSFMVLTTNVYGEQGGAASATPNQISTDLFSSDLMWYIVALILVLVPTFLLGVYMRGGKWGFLIGLAIGAGIAYVVVPSVMPIWMVVLIAIGLGAAFLTSVREGG